MALNNIHISFQLLNPAFHTSTLSLIWTRYNFLIRQTTEDTSTTFTWDGLSLLFKLADPTTRENVTRAMQMTERALN